jgi:hypothetical protein
LDTHLFLALLLREKKKVLTLLSLSLSLSRTPRAFYLLDAEIEVLFFFICFSL